MVDDSIKLVDGALGGLFELASKLFGIDWSQFAEGGW